MNPVYDGTDLFHFDDELSAEEHDLVRRVRAFVRDDLLPVINGYWERAEFPFELLPKLRELGIVGTTIDGYGCPGLSTLGTGLVSMEMARGDGSINTFLGVQSALAMPTIHRYGSDAQKERWLSRMARLELIGAFAMTEPDHGSDSARMETNARKVDGGYVLNGAKRWIGNGSYADLVIIWARDVSDAQVKAFVMEKNADGTYPEGYSPTVITGKVGKRAILQPNIDIDELFVPDENVLPGITRFRDASRVLEASRIGTAWEALGHCIAVYEIARKHVLERQQFGRPLAATQLVQEKLATMMGGIVSLQSMCFRIAQLTDRGQATGMMSALLKRDAVRVARNMVRDARDLLGGNGLLLENHIARHLTDVEVIFTYEGTDSVLTLLVGRSLTGAQAFTAE